MIKVEGYNFRREYNGDKLKIAFITHAIGVGGGSLSSSTTIRYLIAKGDLNPEECIVIHNKTNEAPSEKNDVYFPLRDQIQFFTCVLPFSPIYKGVTSNGLKRILLSLKGIVSCFLFIFFYNHILRKEKVTTVHLNSLVLWPLLLVLPRSMKKIIHIREVPLASPEARLAISVIRRYSTSIISIDPISDIPFSDSRKSRVIINPFDMTKSRYLRKEKLAIKAELGIPPDAFIVSLFGRVGEDKGLDFFTRVVKSSTEIKNLVFLIIGKPSGTYGEKSIGILRKCPNVKYVGEQTDTSKFYAITDVVIRCEDYLPLGRTVWEGIYAGGVSLVPVNQNDDITVIRDYLGKYIYTYHALNTESCIDTMTKIIQQYPETIFDSGYPVTNNMSTSAEQFLEVIRS